MSAPQSNLGTQPPAVLAKLVLARLTFPPAAAALFRRTVTGSQAGRRPVRR